MRRRKRIQPKFELAASSDAGKRIVTGIPKIDDFVKGGYEKGKIYLWGPPAQGKSNFMNNMQINQMVNRLNKDIDTTLESFKNENGKD